MGSNQVSWYDIWVSENEVCIFNMTLYVGNMMIVLWNVGWYHIFRQTQINSIWNKHLRCICIFHDQHVISVVSYVACICGCFISASVHSVPIGAVSFMMSFEWFTWVQRRSVWYRPQGARFGCTNDTRPGKLRKINTIFQLGKSTISTGPFSIAMLVITRGYYF